MKIYLPYQYQNVLILLHSKAELSVLQCLVQSVTWITQVYSGAILISFGRYIVNIIS